MPKPEIVELLEQLTTRFRSWSDLFHVEEGSESTCLSAGERTALLDELHALIARSAAKAPRSIRDAPRAAPLRFDLFRFFTGRIKPSLAEHLRREDALLRGYEALCDRELPFALSSVLLRHYGAIKRSSHPMPARLSSPPAAAVAH